MSGCSLSFLWLIGSFWHIAYVAHTVHQIILLNKRLFYDAYFCTRLHKLENEKIKFMYHKIFLNIHMSVLTFFLYTVLHTLYTHITH